LILGTNVSSPDPENVRREGRVEAKIQVIVVRGKRTIPLETLDVSFKGLFLQTDEPPPVRSLVRLRVRLPTGDIETHAMAVHVSSESGVRDGGSSGRAGVGVQFWGLSGPDRMAWDAFIQGLLQAKKAAEKAVKDAIPPSGESPKFSADSTPSGIRIAPILELDPQLDPQLDPRPQLDSAPPDADVG
jgi:hypothetical protein